MTMRPTSERVRRKLTAAEQERLEVARNEVDTVKDKILLEGRVQKLAWEAMRRDLQAAISELKSEREGQGITLAEIEARSGLKRSELSRLENDPTANPTMLTLQRYAQALGMSVVISVRSGG